jgi:hypothetical protein
LLNRSELLRIERCVQLTEPRLARELFRNLQAAKLKQRRFGKRRSLIPPRSREPLFLIRYATQRFWKMRELGKMLIIFDAA